MATLRRAQWFLLALPLSLLFGCGGGEPENRPAAPDKQAHIRDLGRQYMQYQSRNGGKTPASEAAFRQFLGGKAADALVSPRDKQPYVVRYGLSAKGVPSGAGEVVAYEKVGESGKRFAVTTMANVQELTDDELKKAVPDAK